MAKIFRFEKTLTPVSTQFGKAARPASASRPSTPTTGTSSSSSSNPPPSKPVATIAVLPAKVSAASTPNRSESPLSSAQSFTGFTPVNAPVRFVAPSSAAVPVAMSRTVESAPSNLRSTPPQLLESMSTMVYKAYEHPGFPSDTFNHSNYEYRNYKTSAPPDFKPYKHPAFPRGTFEHSNYSYRNSKSGAGGLATSRSATPSERASTPQIPNPEPPSKRQKRAPPAKLDLGKVTRRPSTSSSSALSSLPFISPPKTPNGHEVLRPSAAMAASIVQRPTKPEERPVRLIINMNLEPEPEPDPDPVAPPSPRSTQKQRDRSPPAALRAKSPPPSAFDPSDPDGEFCRPSPLTLREWEEEDGSKSMVQDYRIFMNGELLVGKVETDW